MGERLTECQQRLVEENWRLVPWVMKKKFGGSIRRHRDDLWSAGNWGLVGAALTYDPEGGQFSTWATRCIWSKMACYVRQTETQFRKCVKVNTALAEYSIEEQSSREEGPDYSEVFRGSDAQVEWDRAVKENRLTPWEVTLLTVRYVEGLSLVQTATRMGLSLKLTIRLLKNIRERCHTKVRRAERKLAC